MNNPPTTIACRDLSYHYSPDKNILQQISLEAHPGQIVGLMGPNGCGKSTLLRCLAGWLVPQSGSVLLQGIPIHSYPPPQRAQIIGMMSQSVDRPMGLSVWDYVSLGAYARQTRKNHSLTQDQKSVIEVALAQFSLLEKASSPVEFLSGGEFQRARLAQLHVQSPKILLFDEPGSFLDWSFQAQLVSYIQSRVITSDAAVILTLHDFNIAMALCNRVIHLQNGEVVADGSPEDMLTPQRIHEVFGLSLRTHKMETPPGIFFTLPTAPPD